MPTLAPNHKSPSLFQMRDCIDHRPSPSNLSKKRYESVTVSPTRSSCALIGCLHFAAARAHRKLPSHAGRNRGGVVLGPRNAAYVRGGVRGEHLSLKHSPSQSLQDHWNFGAVHAMPHVSRSCRSRKWVGQPCRSEVLVKTWINRFCSCRSVNRSPPAPVSFLSFLRL